MYNIKRFLEESVFEPSDVARAASGRIAEDVVHINHKRQVGPGGGGGGGDERGGLGGQARAERGAQGEKLSRYFVVDGVEALSKFGDDAWWAPLAHRHQARCAVFLMHSCRMAAGTEWCASSRRDKSGSSGRTSGRSRKSSSTTSRASTSSGRTTQRTQRSKVGTSAK